MLLDLGLCLALGAAAATALAGPERAHRDLAFGLAGAPLLARLLGWRAVRRRVGWLLLACAAGLASGLTHGTSALEPNQSAAESRTSWSGGLLGPASLGSARSDASAVGLLPPGALIALDPWELRAHARSRALAEEAQPSAWSPQPEAVLRLRAGRGEASACEQLLRPHASDRAEGLSLQGARSLDERFADARHRVRQRLEARAPDSAGLGTALLLGMADAVAPEDRDLFTRTGTRHLLALSGLHLGLLAAGLVIPLVRALHGKGSARMALTVALGVSLIAAATAWGGRSSSLQRAAVAALGALLLPLRSRPGQPVPAVDGWALLGLALGWQALREPGSVHAIGTQLTFTATAGLLRGVVAAAESRATPSRRALPSHPLRRLAEKPARLLALGIRAGWAASLASLPITWSVFGEWAPIGLVLTPLAVPFIALLVGLASLLALLPPGGLAPCLLAATALTGCEDLLLGLLRLGDALPCSPLPLPPRPLPLLLAAAALGPGIGLRLWGLHAGRVGWLLLAALLLPWRPAAEALTVEALAVGHGTAVLVETPDLGAWVFDCGSADRWGTGPALARALAAAGHESAGLVLSHGDADHTQAAAWLSERARVEVRAGWALQAPSAEGRGRVSQPAPASGADGHLGLTLLAEGPRSRLMLVRGSLATDNEGSRSLLLECDGRRVLLSGDAHLEGLDRVLDRLPPLDLLLLPHHGGASPGLARLLERTRPSLAWASRSGPAPALADCERARVPLRTTAAGPLRIRLPPLHQGQASPTLGPP